MTGQPAPPPPPDAGQGLTPGVISMIRTRVTAIDTRMNRYAAMTLPEQAVTLLEMFGAVKTIPVLLDEIERLQSRLTEAQDASAGRAGE